MYRNVRSVGRVKSTGYKRWIDAATAHMGYRDAITGPVRICIAVPTNNRRDLDNYAKPVIDFLVKRGVIESDRCKTVREIHMRWHDEQDVHLSVVAVI